MKNDLTKLNLIALRNLFFEETRAFLSAIDTETAEELQLRRERIRIIDKAIEQKRPKPKQVLLFPNSSL